MASPRATDILTVARHSAEERSALARVTSFVGTKMHKWNKPGNVAKSGAGVGGVFIPVPGLSIATDYIIGKVADKIRSNSHERKQRKYDALLAQNPDDPAAQLKKIKFDIKNLDVKHLDNSMRKLRSQLDQLKKPGPGMSECHRAYEAAYRYYRAINRMQKLKLEAQAMIAVGEEITTFCDHLADNFESAYDGMVQNVEALAQHDVICSAGSGCYNGANGEQQLRRYAEKVKEVDLP